MNRAVQLHRLDDICRNSSCRLSHLGRLKLRQFVNVILTTLIGQGRYVPVRQVEIVRPACIATTEGCRAPSVFQCEMSLEFMSCDLIGHMT
jgi:hypothetical protein